MKFLLLAVLLSGCSTSIQTGDFRFRTYSNSLRLTLSGPGFAMEAAGMNHSTPTAAAFYGASHTITAAGTAALPFAGGVPAAVKVAPVVPATLPAFRINQPLQ